MMDILYSDIKHILNYDFMIIKKVYNSRNRIFVHWDYLFYAFSCLLFALVHVR